ncbi:MAG: helix-turn-helix transcriptional regulator [Deltaproteobacteria bacterium]|nr:helix-turn-helix transcriptional regulator [Deltaproteobacteria bacterium]
MSPMVGDTLRIKRVLVENMKKYRAKLGLTQEQAAEKADMTLKYWQRLEMVSQSDLPSLQMVSKIAKALEIPIWKLLQ